jgi:hypothetical protein
MPAMSTKSREVIFGSRSAAPKSAPRELEKKQLKPSAKRIAPRPKHGRSVWRVTAGPAQPSPTIGQCLNGGYGWMEIECNRCKICASIPLDAIRRPRDTSIWKLEGSFRCRSCGTRRYKPPVHMIRLTQEREITPYIWVLPDDDR